ncbi:MAG: HAMP domain-containing protein, partial [Acidobacteria bacterium]|nr:HAMP domain-containing protein [Acidobacteriota bacterium]
MNKSLRFRLTLLYSGFFAALFVISAALLYGALSHSLYQRLDESVATEADTAAGLFADEYEEVGHNAGAAAREIVNDMKLRGDLVAVLEDEQLLAIKPSMPVSELKSPARRTAERGVTLGGTAYRVVVAASLEPVRQQTALLRRDIAIGLPLALLLAGAGAWLVATRALRPLHAVAEQARRITEHNLNTRLQADGVAAELEVVISSFNDLLCRLDNSFDAMRRFVADASHELRTPVSVIRGEADVALSRERGG